MGIKGHSRFLWRGARRGSTCWYSLFNMFLPAVVAFLNVIPAMGQDSIVDQDVKVNQQIWLDYNPTTILSEYRSLSTQFAYLKIIPEVYNRFQVISTLDFRNKREKGVLS